LSREEIRHLSAYEKKNEIYDYMQYRRSKVKREREIKRYEEYKAYVMENTDEDVKPLTEGVVLKRPSFTPAIIAEKFRRRELMNNMLSAFTTEAYTALFHLRHKCRNIPREYLSKEVRALLVDGGRWQMKPPKSS